MYQHLSLKELRPKLPKVIKQVDESLDRFIITKRGKPTAILLSVDDFESMLETLNETQDQTNLKRIFKGLEEAKAGKTTSWEALKSELKL